MALRFEWDERKAQANETKHDVSFTEAATTFGDPLSLTIHDSDRSTLGVDERYALLGLSRANRLLVVIHTEIGNTIRIISARRATRHERKTYEEG